VVAQVQSPSVSFSIMPRLGGMSAVLSTLGGGGGGVRPASSALICGTRGSNVRRVRPSLNFGDGILPPRVAVDHEAKNKGSPGGRDDAAPIPREHVEIDNL
jgi:hypothetical protein